MSLPLQLSVQEVRRGAVLACENARGAWDDQRPGPGNHKMNAFLCVCNQINLGFYRLV